MWDPEIQGLGRDSGQGRSRVESWDQASWENFPGHDKYEKQKDAVGVAAVLEPWDLNLKLVSISDLGQITLPLCACYFSRIKRRYKPEPQSSLHGTMGWISDCSGSDHCRGVGSISGPEHWVKGACVATAVAGIQFLAWEFLHAMRTAKKGKKEEKKRTT